jgi:hypothetical protein
MFNFIFAMLIAFSSHGVPTNPPFKPYGEGLPLPWPFPWAEECPVKWSSISGRYLLADSDLGQAVELKISIVTQKGLRLVRISRFDRQGLMISDGFVPVSLDQRSVHLELRPLVEGALPIQASLKLFHSSDDHSCLMSRLVPILSLVERDVDKVNEVHYRLIRRPTNLLPN